MKTKEKRIETALKVIKEIRNNKKDFRECLVLAEDYDTKEAKIFKKGFNEGYKFKQKIEGKKWKQ